MLEVELSFDLDGTPYSHSKAKDDEKKIKLLFILELCKY